MENIEANTRVLKRSLVGQMHCLIRLSLISSSFKFPQEHTRTIWGEKILLNKPMLTNIFYINYEKIWPQYRHLGDTWQI